MHPLVADKRSLALYLTAWLLLGLLLALPVLGAELGVWQQALALFVPPFGLLALLGLAAWYPCRAHPVPGTTLGRLAAVHLSAALLSSLLWWGASNLWGDLLGSLGSATHGLRPDLARYLAIGTLLYLLATTVQYLLLAFESSREAQERSLQLRVLAREAELAAFKSQIDPHFLFNCLNSISSLCGSQPEAARQMSIRLGQFLRASLRLAEEEFIPLEKEVALARSYLEIEQVRFGERLRFNHRIDSATNACEVPALLLQPLLENAIKHGLAHLVDGGTISLSADLEGDRLVIRISNPVDPEGETAKGDGIGHRNVAGRLELLYQGRGRLEIDRGRETFDATLNLPATPAAAERSQT